MSTKRKTSKTKKSALSEVFESGVKEALNVLRRKKDLGAATDSVMTTAKRAERRNSGSKKSKGTKKTRKRT